MRKCLKVVIRRKSLPLHYCPDKLAVGDCCVRRRDGDDHLRGEFVIHIIINGEPIRMQASFAVCMHEVLLGGLVQMKVHAGPRDGIVRNGDGESLARQISFRETNVQ